MHHPARRMVRDDGRHMPRWWGPFLVVTTDNGTNVDFMNVAPQHYASRH
jgi:hypothetical protein